MRMTGFPLRKGCLLGLLGLLLTSAYNPGKTVVDAMSPGQAMWKSRERILIKDGWKFMRYSTAPDTLVYDTRPTTIDSKSNGVADARPNESAMGVSSGVGLKKWILPSANDLIGDEKKR